jgi:predicted ribosomally synthesized peptide with nif11-like leader
MEEKLLQLQAKVEADPSLAEELFVLETPAEVQDLLKEQGLDFTLEEIDGLRDLIVKGLEKGVSGELSDDDLEDVAGGVAVTAAISATAAAGSFVHNITRGRW